MARLVRSNSDECLSRMKEIQKRKNDIVDSLNMYDLHNAKIWLDDLVPLYTDYRHKCLLKYTRSK